MYTKKNNKIKYGFQTLVSRNDDSWWIRYFGEGDLFYSSNRNTWTCSSGPHCYLQSCHDEGHLRYWFCPVTRRSAQDSSLPCVLFLHTLTDAWETTEHASTALRSWRNWGSPANSTVSNPFGGSAAGEGLSEKKARHGRPKGLMRWCHETRQLG